jgi:hypothetical protein
MPIFLTFCTICAINTLHLVTYGQFWLWCSLANVDPVDVARSIKDLDPETTLGNFMFHSVGSSLYIDALSDSRNIS